MLVLLLELTNRVLLHLLNFFEFEGSLGFLKLRLHESLLCLIQTPLRRRDHYLVRIAVLLMDEH